MIRFCGCATVEFNRFFLGFLKEAGYTHFWAYGHFSHTESDEDYHIFPIRKEDPLFTFLQGENKLLFSVKDDEVLEMADGIPGIGFMVHIPNEVFRKSNEYFMKK